MNNINKRIYFIMGAFFVLLFLSYITTKAGDFEFGSPTFLMYNTASDLTLSIPMRKCAIGMDDSSKWYVALAPEWLWYSGDAGSTWGSKSIWSAAARPNFSLNNHLSISVLGDSLIIMSNRAATTQGMAGFYQDTSEIGWDTLNYGWMRGVGIGDTVADRFWLAVRYTDSLHYNHSYYYTADIGSNWSSGYVDSVGVAMRCGIFDWLDGYPSFVSFTNTNIMRHEWNGSVINGATDSIIRSEANLIGNERAFSCDGIITDDDSLFFFINGQNYRLIATWKGYNGGTGNYIIDTLDTVSYTSIYRSDYQNTSMIINNKFCIFYLGRNGADIMDSQFLYMRAFNPSDSTWTDEELVTRGYNNQGNVYYANAVQNAHCRQGFLIWEGVSDSVYYLTITDTSSEAEENISYIRRKRMVED
jgi:hypothetical protein